jgi:hypothetical protein
MKVLAAILVLLTVAACTKQPAVTGTTVSVPYANVLILGNSITYSPPNASLNWTGSWGMAATAATQDYVHLLTARFKQVNTKCAVLAKNIAAFETNYDTYDFDAELKSYRESKPDLLILRIGENVPTSFDPIAFAKRYQALIAYMKEGNPQMKIFAAGSFWPDHNYIDAVMSRYTPFISLSGLGSDRSNYSYDRPDLDAAVQQHPGDKGMKAISDMIWRNVQTMK